MSHSPVLLKATFDERLARQTGPQRVVAYRFWAAARLWTLHMARSTPVRSAMLLTG